MKKSIKEILIANGITEAAAAERIKTARNDFWNHLNKNNMEAAYNICEQHFGLEPDYVFELF